ncbi:PHB depolymerase family esterase [Pseudomonas aeruginosa]|uniref:alpha/beta hydrolase family esterase n=1 Tax=Pseudomonas aeruginosa TaxID=287 RepID=UPI000BB56343|nr:PHB depolymerase family esterase [Pseudomonas aeruginosa]EKV4468304.1 PHB depolymerase family esterase [Pseudomonas aeruginosa]ELQ7871842.1 PHB depolymerase family esterase [Pseudomonas aeruginosa]EMD6027512.1 PHB depolymerase family esterase [Pseudomonas aeruginosa]MDI3941064.1 PHB depolymerase family esterase [Pseudomonas aeruginosa]MDI3990806.1 PHB depolymerase family esterase [Pseudomonas aeruginosa]
MRTLIRLVRTLILLLVLALLAGAWWWLQDEALRPPALAGHSEDSSLKVAGLRRHYLLYVPPGVSEGAPLLVVLHGSWGDGAQMRRISGYGFDRLAAQEGFLVAYPDGFEGHWNDCRKAASYSARLRDVDDVAFLRALVARLAQEYRVDPQRVYVAGYSNGGQMAFRLAAEAPGLPAAIATVAASLPTTENDACRPVERPTAALLINGTRDPINPYLGGKVSLFGFGDRGAVRSTLDSARWWAGLNGIAAPPDVAPLTRPGPVWTERQRWQEDGHPPVELLSVHGGGHVLAQPDYRFPRILGKSDPELDAPAEIWRFFSQLPR